MNIKGYLFMAAAATLWGILGPISRLAFEEGIRPMEVAFWRAVLAWLFFGIHALGARTIRVRPADLPLVALFAVTGVTAFYGTYQVAVRQGGAALASVLLYTAPAWVALMARYFFKEPLGRTKLLALALTLAGVVCVAWGGNNVSITPSAIAFGLAAGFCYSLYYIFGKHFATRYSSPNLFFYLLPMGAATLLPWVEFAPKSATAWGALVCIAALSTYGAYFCYYQGVKHLEASRASITATLEPVVACVVAFLWWGESLTAGAYLGSTLILGAVVMMVREGAGRASPRPGGG